MNIFPLSFPTKFWAEKNYLFTQQRANRTLSTHHSPCSALQRGCISTENRSQ